MKKSRPLLIIVILAILNQSAHADQEQSETKKDTTFNELQKMVVTATKTSRKTSELPVNVTIISKEMISSSPAKNIDDLLQYEAGVQVKRAVGMGEGVPMDIIMRGIPGTAASARTLILVDGIPTNVSGTPFLILNEIPIEAVERIEVVRGPFSSLYGANAFGGVINIITETGDGKPYFKITGQSSFPFTSLYNYRNKIYSGKEFWKDNLYKSFWDLNALVTGGNEKFDYLLDGSARTIGNYFLRDSALVRKGRTKSNKSIENHDYRDYRLFFKGGYRFNDNLGLRFHVRFFDSELGFGKTGTLPEADEITKGQKFLTGAFFDYYPVEKIQLKAGGFFRKVNGEYLNETDKTPSEWGVESDDWQLEGNASFHFSRKNILTTGFDYLRNSIDFGAPQDRITSKKFPGTSTCQKTINNAGFYIQDEISFGLIGVIPAIRFDYHSLYKTAVSPKLGLTATLFDNLTLRTSAGRAFRAPSTTELFMPDLEIGPTKLRSNKNLDPEYVTSFDAGAQLLVVKNITLKSDFFYNDLKDLISFSLLIPDLENITGIDELKDSLRVTHVNMDKAFSWGFENSIKWNPIQDLSTECNYTYTKSENLSTRRPLEYIPEHKLNFLLQWNRKLGSGIVKTTVQEGYAGKRGCYDWNSSKLNLSSSSSTAFKTPYIELPSYWRTDLAVSYLIGRYEFLLTAQNLFDASYEESFGTYASGRFMALKIKAGFGG
ncbi:MAG TPA: TonB-dependent receptor [Chitinispirillaceae bacterium]|nr:TonB-dependent receptor [Chitinispirillaceae bacterium]